MGKSYKKRTPCPQWIKDAMPKRCCFCGSTEGICYDHIKPAVFDFDDEWTIENTRPLCRVCHHMISHGQMIIGQGEIMRDHGFLIREGIRRANEKGIKNGRKPADYEKIMQLIAEHSTQFNDVNDPEYEPYTENEIMDAAGVKSVCYHKCKRMLLAAMDAEEWPYKWEKPVRVRHYPLYDRMVKRLRGE